MSIKPRFKFSKQFSGSIWNTLAIPKTSLLLVETRDDKNFVTKFSALDYQTEKFVWEDVTFKESWWIGFTAASPHTVLFHTYVNRANPDHKNLIAYDIFDQKIRWEVEEFSFMDWNESVIWGYHTEKDIIPATISLETGRMTEQQWVGEPIQTGLDMHKPVRYLEGTPHFGTVKKFIYQKAPYSIVMGVEYLEWKNWIVVSVYHQQGDKLANYLLVFDQDGELLMEEKLGENLTGLGTDTFFILSGCLILVKNRTELVVYTYG
ncbi:MAG TPA: DUF4905 domain-containing protein [Cyclobacteriaceae bacterium]